LENESQKVAPINVRGTKVALGPFLPEYLENRLAWLQDPEVSIYSNGTFRVPSREYEKQVNEQFRGDQGVLFAIYDVDTLTLIGEIGLSEINHGDGTAMFGINIGPKEYWNKGYGTEATKLVLDYGFRFLNLYNIALITFSFNERAIRAYQKAGFKENGRRRGALLLNGQRYDHVYMDCLANEFESPQPGWFTL
jgi:RimJ/RimL family protein N-acetyltransferase